MFKHLKDYHRTIYDEVRVRTRTRLYTRGKPVCSVLLLNNDLAPQSAVTSETFEDLSQPADLHPPSGQHNPKLWEHFGYRKTSEGSLVEDGAPICKLCFRKLISKGETTANMMQHLKENHNTVYTEVQVNDCSSCFLFRKHVMIR